MLTRESELLHKGGGGTVKGAISVGRVESSNGGGRNYQIPELQLHENRSQAESGGGDRGWGRGVGPDYSEKVGHASLN